jgi:hypothetical protein
MFRCKTLWGCFRGEGPSGCTPFGLEEILFFVLRRQAQPIGATQFHSPESLTR